MCSMNKPLKIAINGLGRIGRVFLRTAWDNPNFEIAAANSRSDLAVYAHLIKHDSVYGTWDKEIKIKSGNLVIGGRTLQFLQEEEARKLPWKKLGIDFVVDATGKYREAKEAQSHFKAGAKFVLITAPVDGHAGKTLVYGVNHQSFDPKADRIISAASCTSICSALTIKAISEKFGIESGFINTVHALTQDQILHDGSHKDLRRARSAIASIIPTTTGVTRTLDKLFPNLHSKISGLSYRVPVPVPSVLSFTVMLSKSATAESLNQAFITAARRELKGLLDVSSEPLVSIDFKQNSHGAIIDLPATQVVDSRLANIVSWYDNEWGYVSQVTKLLEYLTKKI